MTRHVNRDSRKLAEAIADLLRSNAVFGDVSVIDVGGDFPGTLHLSADQWTVSMVPQCPKFVRVTPTLAQRHDVANHEAIALTLMEQRIEVQTRRHRIATAHGLLANDRTALNADLIMIDRVSALLLDQRGIHPADVVACHRLNAVQSGDEEVVPCVVDFSPIGRTDFIIADGIDASVVTCGMPVGTGAIPSFLFGNVLTLNVQIPATLLVAAVGRPLGDLAATGIPMLDERRIASATSTEGSVKLTLETDLTTIGEARRAMGRV